MLSNLSGEFVSQLLCIVLTICTKTHLLTIIWNENHQKGSIKTNFIKEILQTDRCKKSKLIDLFDFVFFLNIYIFHLHMDSVTESRCRMNLYCFFLLSSRLAMGIDKCRWKQIVKTIRFRKSDCFYAFYKVQNLHYYQFVPCTNVLNLIQLNLWNGFVSTLYAFDSQTKIYLNIAFTSQAK